MSIDAIIVAFFTFVVGLVLLPIANNIKTVLSSKKVPVKRCVPRTSLKTVVRGDSRLSLVPTDDDQGVHVPVNHLTKSGFYWPDKYSSH